MLAQSTGDFYEEICFHCAFNKYLAFSLQKSAVKGCILWKHGDKNILLSYY